MKRNIIVAIVAAGAVIGGGTLAGAAMSTDGGEAAPMSAELDDVTVADGAADTADTAGSEDDNADDAASSVAERAVATALAEVPGVVTETELDGDDDGPRGWEIEIYGADERWHEVRISEDGTEVLGSRVRADDDDRDDDLADATSLLSDSAVIDAVTAIRLAEQHTSATLREAAVDDGHWELELRGDDGEHELRINLASGDITDEERDDDGRDDGDDRDDDRGDDDADDRDDDRDDGRDDGDDRDDNADRDDDGEDDRDDNDDDRGDDDRGDDDADDR